MKDEEHILKKVLKKGVKDIPGQEERMTEIKMERRKLDRHWADSGRGDGQVDVEKDDPT